jgi:hypothetical protein
MNEHNESEYNLNFKINQVERLNFKDKDYEEDNYDDEDFEKENQRKFRSDSLATLGNSAKMYDKSRDTDFNYYMQFFYPTIAIHVIIIIVFVLFPTYPPVYFIQIDHKVPTDSTNIKLSYFYVRYNHKLWSYYDCFNKCHTSPISDCEELDIKYVMNNFAATCYDYNQAKIIFLVVSKINMIILNKLSFHYYILMLISYCVFTLYLMLDTIIYLILRLILFS